MFGFPQFSQIKFVPLRLNITTFQFRTSG